MNSLALSVAVALPIVLAAAVAWPPARRGAAALAPWAALPALGCALWPPPSTIDAPSWLIGLRFGLDDTSRTFLLFTALLWFVAGWAARAYHADDARRHAMWSFWLAALAGNVWLIVALDAAGFYAGFALMTFAGYGLVVHTGSEEAQRAGRVYLVLAVLGEAAFLAGVLLRVSTLGNASLPLALPVGTNDVWAVALLFAGFGVKAGAVGLHVWLPLAHPVAPTPASSVLSGAMIKAGVLGWLRFLPLGGEAWPVFGAFVIVLGSIGAFGAVAVGLTQRAPKTLLAYSSVSQMGFIVIGVGAALLAPAAWPLLATAIALYALHHGLAKGALFLGVAAIPAQGRARGLAFAALALPALALAGAPWTSGALAKHALKAALEALPPPWSPVLAVLMPAAAVGTTLLMARFLLALAGGTDPPKRGMVWPWLTAVALSVGVAWAVAPSAEPGGFLAAALPAAIGIATAVVAARVRPFTPRAAPRIAAGDMLAWLGPAARAAWYLLLAVAALPDRAHWRTPRPRAARRIVLAEDALRRFAVAGLALLVTLAAALLAQWC
jgi:formate hydrogenlyase subunit 3/multisubunit Na+/H+ antiporter MnhD subunit